MTSDKGHLRTATNCLKSATRLGIRKRYLETSVGLKQSTTFGERSGLDVSKIIFQLTAIINRGVAALGPAGAAATTLIHIKNIIFTHNTKNVFEKEIFQRSVLSNNN